MMPLLTSPIDGSPMKQIHRYGIEIDVCPTSGGIWLDRGELEKLMLLLKEESSMHDQPERYATLPKHRANESYRMHDRDDDDDRYERYNRDDGGYKKKSKISKIMDIFDF